MSIEKEQEVKKWEQTKVLFSYKATKMRIAICDGNKNFVKKIKLLIYRYANAKRLDIVADCFIYGEELLSSPQKYNIVFLGYNLAGSNGLEIAKRLRQSNDFSSIIFASEYTDFVFEAFKVRPYRFLRQPIAEAELFTALDEFFEQYGNNYPLWLKCGEDTVCLDTRDIVYLEADNKHAIIHLSTESYRCNRTMARVSEVLPKNHFTKINRAFIVNCDYVKRYNSDTVFLKNGAELHVSRNYLKSFKDEYRVFSNPLEP